MRQKIHGEKRRKALARKQRVRTRLSRARSRRVQLTIYRSAKHIYAQLVEPESGRTITTVSTRSKSLLAGLPSTGGVEAAKKVGEAIATVAKEKNIDRVVFNRNGFLYHGRVKALAEAAREAGLQF
jgi:large subunit ribosomal protein L18